MRRKYLSCKARHAVFGAVYCAAMAWPWGAYERVYWGHGLFSAALGMLALALSVSWFRKGRPNVPFDLFWPVAFLAGGAGVCWAAGDELVSPGVVAGCGAFLLAVFGTSNQALVYRALALSALSAGAVAVLTAAAEFNKVFPTFFSSQGGAVGAGPTNLSDALLLFAWSALVAAVLFLGRRRLMWKAGAWLLPIAAACCGIALFLLARRLGDGLQAWSPNYSTLAFPTLPLLLLALYLASRAAARVFVLAEPRLFCSQTCLGGILLAFSLVLAFVGHFPAPGLCFSFGLIASLGVPRTLRNTEPVKVGWGWLVVVPVIAAHAFVVFPGDSRDYVQQAQGIQDAHGVQAGQDYLGLVLHRFPGESRARLALAELELERGEVEAAADTFLAAVRERRGSSILGRSGPDGIDRFLQRLQERAGTAPGIAYERCLTGAGRPEEAAKALMSRVKSGPVIDIDTALLQRALASVLGLETGSAELNDWTAAELLAGLQLCGSYCQAVQAPEGIPRRYLPAVLTARPLHDGRMVAVFYPGGQCGRSWCMTACSGETPGEGESWWLDAVLDGETGEWYLPLADSADVQFGNELRVSLLEDASLDCGPGPGGWAVMCLLP